MSQALLKRVVAEAIGTAMLLAAVIGSGIMGERLAAGNVALALLANHELNLVRKSGGNTRAIR